jgi:predicted NAD/FAD-binding protein
MKEHHRRHVAVVGTGMAGLTAAYLLHHDPQQRFRVRLIDKVDITGVH